MPKLIKNWKELGEVTSPNYKIIIDKDMCSGWIYPKEETEETKKNWYDHHVYLSTHTFYGHKHHQSTKVLQKYGFDVIIETWDNQAAKMMSEGFRKSHKFEQVNPENVHFAETPGYYKNALDAMIYSIRYIIKEGTYIERCINKKIN